MCKLSTCPFCGSDAVTDVEALSPNKKTAFLGCGNQECTLQPSITEDFLNRHEEKVLAEMAVHWNSRPEKEAPSELAIA